MNKLGIIDNYITTWGVFDSDFDSDSYSFSIIALPIQLDYYLVVRYNI